ncbi:MAG: prepilin peptidase [Alphaproteobacteria bacterium]|nr:prepilin peptidase [Alphaproteobacteria bacterium]
MMYAVFGFLFGLLIPYMARRFAKFMPATMAYGLYRLVAPTKKVSRLKRSQNGKYQKLVQKYLMRSIGWGVVTGALSAATAVCLTSGFYIALVWILLLLYEIDERMFLLPDLLTVPLLILGFVYAATLPLGDFVFCSPAFESAVGAAVGYGLPVVASLFMVRKHPDAFGGGDIKLLSAVGAWIGFGNVPALILISCIVFGLFCLVKHQRAGAFGPAIVIATLILIFLGATL